MTSDAILRCDKLEKRFGAIRALSQVSLEFPATGICAIIGPNGAGKTTLLNVISGFARPDKGHCFFRDKEITQLQAHNIAKLGITRTFQDLRLIHGMTVLENVLLGQPSGQRENVIWAIFARGAEERALRDQAMETLGFVGLQAKAGDLTGELSYGQQKLLSIACCLAAQAPVLLLDEPVAGVEPWMAQQVLDLLRKMRNLGKLVVFIEHDMSAVRETADIVVLMDEGRVITQGPPKEVLDQPQIMEAYLA